MNRVLSGRLLAALAPLALAACGSGAQTAKAPPPLSIVTARVARETIATFTNLDGTVDPFLQSNIATEQGGTILAIYANEGDRVTHGQALAKIDDAPLRATLTEQQGARGAAVAKLAESRTQLPITDTLYASALTQAEQSLSQARYQTTADRANEVNTKATYVADEQLERQGFLALTTFQQARAAFVAAQQLLGADETKVTQARAAVTEARRNRLNSQLQGHVVEENRGTVQQAQGSVQLTQTQLGETTLVAPFSGVITSRLLDPGAFASSNQAIYQISQIDPTYVDFNLKDTDLAYVREDTPVTFTTPSRPGRRYDGRVRTINAVPTAGTLLYRARVVMANADYSLRGGMLVNVRVQKDRRRDALVVPRDAITQDDGKGVIYAIVPAAGKAAATPDPAASASAAPALQAERIQVRTGLQTDTYVEVISPRVRAGMTIAATRPDQLGDKTPVRVGP